MLLAIGCGAHASSLWQINEIYSNADGSVQFISESIDLTVYRALATCSTGEVVQRP